MSKPFDLEAAKRGEPVEIMLDPTWVPVHFVGIDGQGHPVVQRLGDGPVFSVSQLRLRMAPKKVTVRYRVAAFLDVSNEPYPAIVDNQHLADAWERVANFKQWLTDWKKAEI